MDNKLPKEIYLLNAELRELSDKGGLVACTYMNNLVDSCSKYIHEDTVNLTLNILHKNISALQSDVSRLILDVKRTVDEKIELEKKLLEKN